jgi:hypothetical protein
MDLEFLIEYFSGDYSKTTLSELKDMTDEKLEEILEGSMYVKRIRSELDRIFYGSATQMPKELNKT